jgi:hypothetical protein
VLRRITLLGLILVLVGLTITLALVTPATAQDTNSSKITAPKDGDSLFGLVNILGTASNPNMQRYTLQFDFQESQPEQWFPIAGPITQQVKDGVLGQWNTTSVPDGRYQIRLRVVLRDGTVLEDKVQNLHVSNKQPTALPTVLPTTTNPTTTNPTAGPSSTPLIQQPPSNTPRPAIPTVVVTVIPPSSDSSSGSDAVTVFSAMQNAFCTGAYVALGVFFVIGVYAVIHSRLRPVVRRLMNQIRNG